MSENGNQKTTSKGCFHKFSVVIIASIAIFVVIVVFCLVTAVIASLLNISSDQLGEIWLYGILVIFLMLVVVVGIMIYFRERSTLRKRYYQIDSLFAALGMTGRSYLGSGRQYHGIVDDRTVAAYFYPGPSMDIYIALSLNTRLGIGVKGGVHPAVFGFFPSNKLVTDDPAISFLSIYSLDKQWARKLLENAQAKVAILRLSLGQRMYKFHDLLFQPEWMQFRIKHISLIELNAENFQTRFNDLFDLVSIVETLPAPTVTVKTSHLAQKIIPNRSNFTCLIFGIICLIISIVAAIIIILT